MKTHDELLTLAAYVAVAVADDRRADAHAATRWLTRTELADLTMILAAHVDVDKPFVPTATRLLDEQSERLISKLVLDASERFRVTTAQVVNGQAREAADARFVVAYSSRLLRISSTKMGQVFGCDHTTILYRAGKVGEDARLRGIAGQLAEAAGWDRNQSQDRDRRAS